MEPLQYPGVGQNDLPDGTIISKDLLLFLLYVASGLNAESYRLTIETIEAIEADDNTTNDVMVNIYQLECLKPNLARNDIIKSMKCGKSDPKSYYSQYTCPP